VDRRIIALDLEGGEEIWRVQGGPGRNGAMLYHREKIYVHRGKRIEARSAVSGETLWSSEAGSCRYGSSRTVLFTARGLLWSYGARKSELLGLDLETGKVKRTISMQKAIEASTGHPRCYQDKATECTLWTTVGGKAQQMIDLDSGENYSMPWLRAGCRIGVLPCNGLIYITPHPCACYIGVKLNGLRAMASEGSIGPEVDTENGLSGGQDSARS
jgi:hypothetical protein